MAPRPYQNVFLPPRIYQGRYSTPRLACINAWDTLFRESESKVETPSAVQAISPPPSPPPIPTSSHSDTGRQLDVENDDFGGRIWSSAASSFNPPTVNMEDNNTKINEDASIGDVDGTWRPTFGDMTEADMNMPLTPTSVSAVDAQTWVDEMDMAIDEGWHSLASGLEENKNDDQRPSTPVDSDANLPDSPTLSMSEKVATTTENSQSFHKKDENNDKNPPVDHLIQSLSHISLRPTLRRVTKRISLPPTLTSRPAASMPLPIAITQARGRAPSSPARTRPNHNGQAEGELTERMDAPDRPRTPIFGARGRGASAAAQLRAFKYRRLSFSPPRITKTLRTGGRRKDSKGGL